MSRDGIQTVLFDVLKEVQKLSGYVWEDIPSTAIPLLTLPGFDSLCSVEATVMVEQKLECGELQSNSVFISPDGKRALTIIESSELIEKLINERKKQ